MNLWRRPQAEPPPVAVGRPMSPHFLRAWTEDLYISGFASGSERLSDLLNRREPLKVDRPMVHGLRSAGWPTRPEADVVLDPFDLELVLGLAARDGDRERQAKRIHKVRYPVAVEGQDFEITGTVHVFPGNPPEFVLHHTGQLFLPISEPTVRRQRRLISDRDTDVALVNRYAVHGIRQLDTPLRH